MPGDIPDPYASSFGFQARGSSEGMGDGNGVIEGNSCAANTCYGTYNDGGETTVFWQDLSTAKLIEGSFTFASTTTYALYGLLTLSSTPPINAFFPAAKIGQGNFISVISNNSINYFNISAIWEVGSATHATLGLTVAQAYNMDKKLDDGLPQSGRIVAEYVNFEQFGGVAPSWGLGWAGTTNAGTTPYTTATPGTTSTCFDNAYAGGAAAPMQYSTEISNGSGLNCALSFQMQGAGR